MTNSRRVVYTSAMTNQAKTGIAVAAGLAVVALFFIFNGSFSVAQDVSLNPVAQVTMQDEVVGTGAEAKVGDTVSVQYTGKLQDGTVFDTSVGKAPISFVLGAGMVIPGWEQGLLGMKVGGKRLLIIPPSLAYGSIDYGPIPANSTLVFEVELVKVTPAATSTPTAN